MVVMVRMLAFMDGELRPVTIPDEECQGKSVEELLGVVYYYGQNDFQPIPKRCSVSVGDVALLQGKFWIVARAGWDELTPDELEEYEKLERRDRLFWDRDRLWEEKEIKEATESLGLSYKTNEELAG